MVQEFIYRAFTLTGALVTASGFVALSIFFYLKAECSDPELKEWPTIFAFSAAASVLFSVMAVAIAISGIIAVFS